MSLKSVELQIAVSRTQDAGHMQQQTAHKTVADQFALAETAVKQADEQRRKSAKVEEQNERLIRDQPKEGGAGQHGGKALIVRKRSTSAPHQTNAEHPFKGRHIDITY